MTRVGKRKRRHRVGRGQRLLEHWVKSHEQRGRHIHGHWRKGGVKKPRRRDYTRAKIVSKGDKFAIRANGELLGGSFTTKEAAEQYAKKILGVKKIE